MPSDAEQGEGLAEFDEDELRRLIRFWVVATAGGYRKAEQVTSLAASTFQRDLSALERHLGASGAIGRPLSEKRAGADFKLTRDGERLRELLDGPVRSLLEAYRAFHGAADPVRVGASHFFNAYFMPTVLDELHRSAARFRVRVSELPKRDVFRMLERKELDLGVGPVADAPPGMRPVDDWRLAITYRLIVPESRKLQVRHWKDLEGEPWIMYSQDTATRYALDRTFQLQGVSPRTTVVECRDEMAMIGYVARGLGTALIAWTEGMHRVLSLHGLQAIEPPRLVEPVELAIYSSSTFLFDERVRSFCEIVRRVASRP